MNIRNVLLLILIIPFMVIIIIVELERISPVLINYKKSFGEITGFNINYVGGRSVTYSYQYKIERQFYVGTFNSIYEFYKIGDKIPIRYSLLNIEKSEVDNFISMFMLLTVAIFVIILVLYFCRLEVFQIIKYLFSRIR